MIQKGIRQRKPKKAEKTVIEGYLKQLPPPEEHAYELKMERRLKRLVKKEEKKKAAKNLS